MTLGQALYYGYQVQLHFTRLFIKGNLEGIYHTDAYYFHSRQRAMEWLDGVERNGRDGHLDYRITAYLIETLKTPAKVPGTGTDI